MLFKRQTAKLKRMNKRIIDIILPLIIVIILAFTGCAPKGSIVIFEQPFGGQFDISFHKWSGQNKCEMSMAKGDTIQVDVTCEGGELSLSIQGKNGSEPYTGNGLDSGIFTVTVSETDDYIIKMNGTKVTGEILLTHLSE